MALRDRDPILENLENLQEEQVLGVLRRQLKEAAEEPGVCTCTKCFIDMVALALNALPPRYVADKYNKFGETLEEEAKAAEQLEGAVRLAIHRVAGRPHHP